MGLLQETGTKQRVEGGGTYASASVAARFRTLTAYMARRLADVGAANLEELLSMVNSDSQPEKEAAGRVVALGEYMARARQKCTSGVMDWEHIRESAVIDLPVRADSVGVLANGDIIAGMDDVDRIYIIDRESLQVKDQVRTKRANAFLVTPDDRIVCVGGAGIDVYDVQTGDLHGMEINEWQAELTLANAFMRDTTLYMQVNKHVYACDLASGTVEDQEIQTREPVNIRGVDSDGNFICTVPNKPAIYVVDPGLQKVVNTYENHLATGEMKVYDVLPDDSVLFSCGWIVEKWNPRQHRPQTLSVFGEVPAQVLVHPVDPEALCVVTGHVMFFIDMHKTLFRGPPISLPEIFQQLKQRVAVSLTGELIIAADRSVRIWGEPYGK